jgi:hypothetical protein
MTIPINPFYERLNPPIPQAGNYDARVTIYNLHYVIDEYMSYFPNKNNRNDRSSSILYRIGNLFNELISGDEIINTEDYFASKIERLDNLIKNSNLNNMINSNDAAGGRSNNRGNLDEQLESVPIIDLIQTWKDIIRYLLRLRDEYDEDEFEFEDGSLRIPGPKLEIPDAFDESTLFSFLTQPFFNDQSGGVNINGDILQKIIINHYNNIYNKIIRQISGLFDDIKEKIERATELLLPFDVNQMSDLENLNKVKKLFGTEEELMELLDAVSFLIKKIYEYYKIDITIPSNISDPFISNYINSNYNNPAILNVDYLARKATIVVLNGISSPIEFNVKNNLLNNMNSNNSREYGIYDYLTGIDNFSTRERIQKFLDIIRKIKTRSIENVDDKDDITERLEKAFRDLTDNYINRTSDDIKLDITSTYSSDYSLLEAYNKYLKGITSLRRKIKNKLQEIDDLFDDEKEIYDLFYDTYVGSTYFKIIMANKWLLANDDYTSGKRRKGL